MGNYMEDKKDSKINENLEYGTAVVFQGNWMECLDKIVRNDFKSYKEQRTKLCGLLRVIRNKIEHIGHLGKKLRAIYQNSPEGVVQYYHHHFPKLMIYTFRIEQEWEKNQEPKV
jgi:hypothetical protein